MNATEIAATLSVRAADVCRRYLPRGRKQGRYWTVGDPNGAKGRLLFMRLAPPGIPGTWTDAATNEHGDLLDLICLHTGEASLGRAMDEAHAFLTLTSSAPANGSYNADGYDREEAARRLWRGYLRCPPACRKRHRNRATSGHRRRPHSCRSSSFSGQSGRLRTAQDLALLVIARDKDMEDEHAVKRLQHRCAERGIPSIVMVSDRSDLNDGLVAFGEETLVARIAPFIASTRSAATVEERRGSGRIIIPS